MLDRALAPLFRLAGEALLRPDPEALRKIVPDVKENAFLTEELEQELLADPDGIRLEHARLFLSPEGAPCPPWQSACCEPKTLMGWPHHRALAWYRSEGMEPEPPNEPADHAGLLLLFLAHLLNQGAPPERVQAYYEDHLKWVAGFCAGVDRETRHPFFRTVAETLELALQPAVVCQ